MADADLDVLIRIREEGMGVFREMRSALEKLAAESITTNLILRSSSAIAGDAYEGLERRLKEVKELLGDIRTRMLEVDVVANASRNRGGGGGGIPVLGGLTGGFNFLQALPGQTWVAVLIALLLTLAPIFSSFVAMAAAATVVMVAFTVAGTGLVALFGIMLGGFALLGAAVALLGYQYAGGTKAIDAAVAAHKKLVSAQEAAEVAQRSYQKAVLAYDTRPTAMNAFNLQTALEHLHDAQLKVVAAQDAVNAANAAAAAPLGKLDKDWEQLGQTLGKAAAPAFNQIVKFLDSLIPLATQVGTTLIKWFADRLPGALATISQVMKELGPDFQALGQWLSHFFDTFADVQNVNKEIGGGGSRNAFFDLFESGVRTTIKAIEGLLTNLKRLSDWFVTNWPKMGPVVMDVLGGLGAAVQFVAAHWAEWAQWLSDHWPGIVDLVHETIKSIGEAWTQIKPVWDVFIANVWPVLSMAFLDLTKNAGNWVGVLMLVIGAIIFLSALILGTVDLISRLLGVWNWLMARFAELPPFITSFGALGDAIGVVWWVVDKLWGSIQTLWGWLGDLFAQLQIKGPWNVFMEQIDKAAGKLGLLLALWQHINTAAQHTPALPTGGGGGGRPIRMAMGGTVPGDYGEPRLIIAHGGERIIPTVSSGGGGGDMSEVIVLLQCIHTALTAPNSGTTGVAAALYEAIQRATNNRNRGMVGGLL